MKAFVDSTRCSGYGACAELCPSVFTLDEWGYAATTGLVPDGDEDAVREAAATCPEQAIRHES
ncbi:ferredoxin [Pseudonocardia sp.]|uniref:ferredoxin n=1 Tax=Pseudonocardia sp. TaxID=60912 RepID=UPI003D1518C8